jgi:hypothetical protein
MKRGSRRPIRARLLQASDDERALAYEYLEDLLGPPPQIEIPSTRKIPPSEAMIVGYD